MVVFDPARIADRLTYEDLDRYALGVSNVVVNGQVVVDGGDHTARFPGVCSGEGRALLHLFTALAKRHRREPLQQLNNRAIADRRPRRTNIR